MKKVIMPLIASLSLALAAPKISQAQFLDPDKCWTCSDTREHFAGGAILDLAVRGPWVAESFRNRLWKREAMVCTIGATYEALQYFEAKANNKLGERGYGFSLKDLAADCLGALAMEGIIHITQKKFNIAWSVERDKLYLRGKFQF